MTTPLEVMNVSERPRAWLVDLAPKVFENKEGDLVIEGDPVLTGMQGALIWAPTILVGVGAPWLTQISMEPAANRIAFAIWCLIVFSVPFLIMAFYPSLIKLDGRSGNLSFTYGLGRRVTIVIPFDEIAEIRRKKVCYRASSYGRYPELKATDLAYIQFKPDVPSINLIGELLLIPILSVDSSSMDTFLERCERYKINVT